MPFESPDWRLDELLRSVGSGALQLPDFQRTFKWDDTHIVDLLASVSRGYPIGVIMTVETGGDGSRFKWRPLEGTKPQAAAQHPTLMLLDGQQRLTSLYQALMSDAPVQTLDTRGDSIKRWYYISIDRALADDEGREDAIIGVPHDRKIRSDFGRKVDKDYSTEEYECAAGMFPLHIVFDANRREDWSDRYKAQGDDFRLKWQEFRSRVLDSITNYMIPLIKLSKETPRDAVCTVFEKVNTGGVQLTVFELMTATFAGDRQFYDQHGKDFELGEDWKRIRARLLNESVLAEFATEIGNPAFLQAICLLATRERRINFVPRSGQLQPPPISCKRSDMLRLKLPEYLQWRDSLADAFKWCARFLKQEYIFRPRDLPYPSQLVPLAVLRVLLGRKADNLGVYAKLRRWYWCGVLGELYGGTTESRSARDVEQVLAWITSGGAEPETIASATFRENRLLSLTSRQSAAYKGLYALIMSKGCDDWLRKQRLDFAMAEELQVDVHHIFPREWCRQNAITGRVVDSIVNKTAISFHTNRSIGGRSPADYIPLLEQKAGIDADAMNSLIESHSVSSQLLRAGDFRAFFADRADRLLHLIGEAMGNEPIRTGALDQRPDVAQSA
jgi:hypothetical protein